MSALNTITEMAKTKLLPQWKVLLHNDDVNDATVIVERLQSITHLKPEDAIKTTEEAHKKGMSIIVITHRELAELYLEQFSSCTPPVRTSIEPA